MSRKDSAFCLLAHLEKDRQTKCLYISAFPQDQCQLQVMRMNGGSWPTVTPSQLQQPYRPGVLHSPPAALPQSHHPHPYSRKNLADNPIRAKKSRLFIGFWAFYIQWHIPRLPTVTFRRGATFHVQSSNGNHHDESATQEPRPAVIRADEAAYYGLQEHRRLQPPIPNSNLEAATAAHLKNAQAERSRKPSPTTPTAIRDARAIAENKRHNVMNGCRTRSARRNKEDSDEVASMGLKRSSKRRPAAVVGRRGRRRVRGEPLIKEWRTPGGAVIG